MPLAEQIKKAAETVTGIGRPSADDLVELVNRRTPRLYQFEDDGKTPNNPSLPLMHYHDVLRSRRGLDSAAARSCSPPMAGRIPGATGSMISCISTPALMKCLALRAARPACSSAATRARP